MKSYNSLNPLCGTHKTRVKMQIGEFKGSFVRQEYGCFKGYELLRFNPLYYTSSDIDKWISEDCEIVKNEDNDVWYVTLTNPENGYKRKYRLPFCEILNIIVGIDIIEFEPNCKTKLPTITCEEHYIARDIRDIIVFYDSETKGEVDK